jgi:nucleoid-associated protein YgaU
MSIPMKLEKAKLVKTSGGAGGGIAGAAAGLAASGAGIGGMMPVVWNDSEMNFRFNPTQMTVNKTAVYGGANNRASEEGGQEQFASTGTRTLGFSAFLDEWEAPQGGDVGEMVAKLQNWCNPDPESSQENREPPLIMFVWGKFNFTGKLESVNATFELFRRDGTPARAEVQISMKERPEETVPQNPTSGGPPGRRSRTIVEGDTLLGLAYRELGDANLWRIIAEINDIDDPMTVPAGTSLLVPSREDATFARRNPRAG